METPQDKGKQTPLWNELSSVNVTCTVPVESMDKVVLSG